MSGDDGEPAREAGVAIHACGLRKAYDDVVAVDGVDLRVPAGTVYGFLGPNGAGKTTTIELLTGMTAPTAGSATVAGVPVTDRDALKSRIGYLPAESPLYESFSAREQLEYVAVLEGMDEAAARGRIESLLRRVGLLDAADRSIDGYSTGMRRKLGLVQAVLHRPDVLFLDEPTAGLDPRATRDVVELVDDLVADGTTVLLSTHVLPVVEELADRVGVLRDGRLVAEGAPAELRRRATEGTGGSLEAAFLAVTSDQGAMADRATTDSGTASRP